MIFYGIVSGIALLLESIWLLAKSVGIEIPLPAVLREDIS